MWLSGLQIEQLAIVMKEKHLESEKERERERERENKRKREITENNTTQNKLLNRSLS